MAGERFEIAGADGSVESWGYLLANAGGRFMMAVPDSSVQSSGSFQVHEAAFSELVALDDALAAIQHDKKLSDFGKSERIEKLSGVALGNIAAAVANMDATQSSLDRIEAEALSPGVVDPGDLAGALLDQEIRAWFAAQKNDPKVLAEIGKLDLRVQAALMRSPIPIAEPAREILRKSWDEAKRVQDPIKHRLIASGRKSIGWARCGLLQMAGIARVMVGLPSDRLLHLLTSNENELAHQGLHVFGFSSNEVAMAKQWISAERRTTARRAAAANDSRLRAKSQALWRKS